ncbi:MAG: hypothetical protein AB7O38_25300 [Pirellulaceae bacterium]
MCARTAVLLVLLLLATACSRSPLGPTPVTPAPDPIALEGTRHACVTAADLYPFWGVRSTDGQPRTFSVVRYDAPAPGCDPVTGQAAIPVAPMVGASPLEATFYLAPSLPACGRSTFVLAVDGVTRATVWVDTGVACG